MSKDVNGSLVRWSCVQRNRKSLPVEKNKTEVQREAEMRESSCVSRETEDLLLRNKLLGALMVFQDLVQDPKIA